MSKSEARELCDDRRKLEFLKHLAATSHVAASAEAAGVAKSTVYHWRTRDAEFYAGWMKALADGYELLETEMLDRARNGKPREVFYHGRHIATVREYDDRIALGLLMAHRETVALTRAVQSEFCEGDSDIREKLDRRLKDMRRRLAGSDDKDENRGAENKERHGGNMHR